MPIEITLEKLKGFIQKRYNTASAHLDCWEVNFNQAFGAWTLFIEALVEAGRVDEATALCNEWTNKWYPKFWNIRHAQLGIELLEVIE